MQVVDSLLIGGMEMVAVNLANLLAERGMRSYLCCTRLDGPLSERVSPQVERLNLHRRGRFDFAAFGRLARFLRTNQIDILHAHGSSLFLSILTALAARRTKVVWHLHLGRYATADRYYWIYRSVARCAGGVIAVNQPLVEWACSELKVPSERVWRVPNFVLSPPQPLNPAELPGPRGKRLVCVANFRPEKGHLTLIEAMNKIVRAEPAASLFLVGAGPGSAHREKVRERIQDCGLQDRVFVLGSRSDVWNILAACDVGVLASTSEGMPLALLEYGTVGLPVVASAVGQAPDVLNQGQAGILVAPGQPTDLAEAILRLVQSADLRQNLGAALKNRVQNLYSDQAILHQIVHIYETVRARTKPASYESGQRVFGVPKK